MSNFSIDSSDIGKRNFVRFHDGWIDTDLKEPSNLINTASEKIRRALECNLTGADEYIVKLDNTVIDGSTRALWVSDKLYSPTAIRRGRKGSYESFTPPEAFKKLGGDAQIAAFRWSENYFHWTYQSLAAVLDMLEEGISIDRLIVTPLKKWQRRTLELTGIDLSRCIEIDRKENYQFDMAYYSSFLSKEAVHRPSARLITLFDEFATRHCSSIRGHRLKNVYITRVGAAKRSIENEAEVCALVNKFGFEVIQTEKMSIDEQISLFRGVSNVVAPHGAGLVNLLYSQNCQSLTEIFQADCSNACMFRICQAKGIQHFTLQAECAKNSIDWRGSVSKVDLDALEAHLEYLVGKR